MATCPFNGFKPCESACAIKVNGICGFVALGGRLTQVKQAIEGLQGSVDELALLVSENGSDGTEEAPKVVREVSDQEVDQYVEAVNPLTIANVSTSQVYKDFERWCSGRGLSPCTQMKLSRRITHFHPLEAKVGTFVPIAKGRC